MESISSVLRPMFLATWLSGAAALAMAQEALPDGQSITPTAAPGAIFDSFNPGLSDYPKFTAGQAVTSVVSPDGTTLLVLTSGYNRNNDVNGKIIPRDSNEYVFVFDITSGSPVQKQIIQVPNTYSGIAFSPDGAHFYVSGGKDDSLHTYTQTDGSWAETGNPIPLAHGPGNGLPQGSNTVLPAAAGLAVTADGKTTVVANYENDSISLVSAITGAKTAELDLRPGKNDPLKAGVPGGEFPYWVTIKGNDIRLLPLARPPIRLLRATRICCQARAMKKISTVQGDDRTLPTVGLSTRKTSTTRPDRRVLAIYGTQLSERTSPCATTASTATPSAIPRQSLPATSHP